MSYLLPRVPCRYLTLNGSFYLEPLLVEKDEHAKEIAVKYSKEIDLANKMNPIKNISLTQMTELALAFKTNQD